MEKEKDDITDMMEEIFERATEDYRRAEAGWQNIRDNAIKDQRFYHGNHAADDVMAVARARGEPMLTVNRLPTFVKQVENELRQREMAITAACTDENGSEDTANIITGMIRAIESRSNAKAHYIHAAGENGALVPGFGYLKAVVDYASDTSFDQDITITSVKDPMKIIPDPSALEPDFSDGNFWFEVMDYSEGDFKRFFPHAMCQSADMFPVGARLSGWLGENTIRVARYWYKRDVSRFTYLLDDGTVATEEDVDEYFEDDEDDRKSVVSIAGNKKIVLRRRELVSSTIEWADVSGAEVLDQGSWVGSMFPFVAVTGPMSVVDGERDIRGIIRFAKDSQKMLNYFASSTVRRIASANKAPWIVAKESIAGLETQWNKSSTSNAPYLSYHAFNAQANMSPNPPPQRADQTGQIQDLLAASQKFEDDLKATIGIYDAGLGATPNEQSGVAIKTLAQQGQNANFHFSDNLTSSLKRMGDILIDLIPKVYDAPRIVKTVGAEGDQRMVKINDLTREKGKDLVFDVAGAAGKYGITVNVGPAYATAKQAAVSSMLDLIRVNPNIAPYVQDVIAGNMDFVGKDIVRDRLLKVLTQVAPNIVETPDQAEIPPQAQAAMAQQNAVIQNLTAQYQQLQQEAAKNAMLLQTKQIEHQQALEKAQLDQAFALQLEDTKSKNSLALQQQRTQTDAVVAQANVEMTAIKTQLSHTEKMMGLVLESMKLFGPDAGRMIAATVPVADATIDNAIQSNPYTGG